MSERASVTGEILIREARKLRGVPFVHAGRNEHGLDCVGLIMLPAWRLELTDYQPRNYGPEPDRAYLVDALERLGTRIWSRGEDSRPEGWRGCASPGDVLLVNVKGHPSHLAYWTGDNSIIHCHGRHGVQERPLDPVTGAAVAAVYRWRNTEGE